MPRASRRTRSLWALAGLVALACAPSGAGGAAGVSGTARDANTGEPIVGAWIFQSVPSRQWTADVRRFARVAIARTDARGRFRFPDDARSLLARALPFVDETPARYHFYHPSYGLVWGREASRGGLRIEARLRDAHLRQRDALLLCTGEERDALRRTVRDVACPPNDPSRFPDGSPRATGPVDERGRRTGAWTFYRADGSRIATGTYQAGGAVGEWEFYPIDAE